MNKINIKRKKLLILLVFIFLVSDICLIYVSIKYDKLKRANIEITNEIDKINEDILNIDADYEDISLELDNKKSELKDKIEEYNIWMKMIEKLK